MAISPLVIPEGPQYGRTPDQRAIWGKCGCSGGMSTSRRLRGRYMSMPLSAEAALGADPVRARLLLVTKRRATGLLGVMSAVFVTAVLAGDNRGLLGFVRAGAEASLVGGLADWFAVTALFRHPLGLPIPHTAVIPERKDQFAKTLATFVQDNLLT